MTTDKNRKARGFSQAARRYTAPAQRERRAEGFLGPATKGLDDSFRRAISELSMEDEDLPGLEDQGPVVFRDGVFQIEFKDGQRDSTLDPALLGLIDSILKPKLPPERTGEGR